MPAPAPVHAPASSTRRAPRTSGTHPSGSTSPPHSRSRGPGTRNSSVRQRTRIHCKEAAHRHQRRRRARNITHSSRAFRPNPGPRNTRTPGQPHRQTIRRGPAPSGKTCSLARDGDGEPRWSRGSRSRGRPWPAMGAASPATEDVSQTWAESPPWARQAPPRRDVSQTTDLLDPSGRSQGMRMIMCREHPDESARRDSRTSASAVFAPVARIPCSTMRRHVLMHEDDGKSQCRPPSMGSSAMTSPELSPLTS